MHTHKQPQQNKDQGAIQAQENTAQRPSEVAHKSAQGQQPTLQAKQRPIQRRNHNQSHKAKHQPIQRTAQTNDLKTQMGNQHGVDLSGFKEHSNKKTVAKTKNSQSTKVTQIPTEQQSKKAVEPSYDPSKIGQKGVPKMASSPPSKKIKQVALSKTACMVHGIDADHVKGVIQQGYLSCAYRRLGPGEDYSRPADKTGGGALGVYLRLVGSTHTKWPVKGYGVGANTKSKVQLVFSPEILEKGEWRVSSMDGMGKVPGVQSKDLTTGLRKTKTDWGKTKELWSKQNEASRNQVYNGIVEAQKPIENNEIIFWDTVPIEGFLRAIMCSSKATFNTLAELPEYDRSNNTLAGIPIISSEGDASLLKTLASLA
ncbi:hypothetical protein [Microscilla marina]|uniref:Uncharacterized protein n=1 Tax=Microscilla marina ATCC 23134 TaxID=313606 RepID=A1ZVV5_MICM2|nr:hypothetical protein [Microscilla marina]EAY25532.1 hypothetical protein M23134_06231 [Microscilla marina ATCC 23134]